MLSTAKDREQIINLIYLIKRDNHPIIIYVIPTKTNLDWIGAPRRLIELT